MEVAPILEDLKKMFSAQDRLDDWAGAANAQQNHARQNPTDPEVYLSQKLAAENRLRCLVGAPVVAH